LNLLEGGVRVRPSGRWSRLLFVVAHLVLVSSKVGSDAKSVCVVASVLGLVGAATSLEAGCAGVVGDSVINLLLMSGG
jgi:hypothetical protein